jgi:O-antigen/teichoic acid export membrane protein
LKQGATGLITGQLFSQMLANMKLLKNILKDKDLLSKISKVKIIALAKRYKKFPKYSMWAGLFNNMSMQLTNILITLFYAVSTLGFYSLVQRVLAMPASLVGNSIGQVFFQEASKEKQETGSAQISFNSTLKKLILLGIVPFGVLFFIVEDLFAFVFGEEWRIAGTYAQILIPLFFIRFFVSPLTVMNVIFPKNHIGLYWQIGLLLLHTGILLISSQLNLCFERYLYIMTIIISMYYLLILYIISTYNNLEKKRV